MTESIININTSMPDFADKLMSAAKINGIDGLFTPEKCAALERFTAFMLEYNKHTNLTAIREPDAVITKHIIDSALLLKYVPTLAAGSMLVDIGCGAGFPSVPVAILSGTKVSALDCTLKKTDFIAAAVKHCGIDGVTPVCGRAEELARVAEYRERFDFATARAVAKADVLCELALPFVKVGGRFVIMKADAGEVSLAVSAAKKLGGEVGGTDEYRLSGNDGGEMKRTLIIVRKIQSTCANYPRAYAQITKKPL